MWAEGVCGGGGVELGLGLIDPYPLWVVGRFGSRFPSSSSSSSPFSPFSLLLPFSFFFSPRARLLTKPLRLVLMAALAQLSTPRRSCLAKTRRLRGSTSRTSTVMVVHAAAAKGGSRPSSSAEPEWADDLEMLSAATFSGTSSAANVGERKKTDSASDEDLSFFLEDDGDDDDDDLILFPEDDDGTIQYDLVQDDDDDVDDENSTFRTSDADTASFYGTASGVSIPDGALPRVALVGRPNVGKSAIFNRICGAPHAVVSDYPGVTRDRLFRRATHNGREFMLVDTGGVEEAARAFQADVARALGQPTSANETVVREERDWEAALKKAQRREREMMREANVPLLVETQSVAAIRDADSIILVTDGQAGLTESDAEMYTWLRRTHPNKPCFVSCNKCESTKTSAEMMTAEFYELGHGLENVYAMSAISGTGVADLLDDVVTSIDGITHDAESLSGDEEDCRVCIIGRPNVGKSSLLNQVLGEERLVVSDMAGTTRDAVDVEVVSPEEPHRKVVFVDTAGMRRRQKVSKMGLEMEAMSVGKSLFAMRRSDVAVLVLDALQGPTEQDFKIADIISNSGRAVVLCVNKWDTLFKETNTMIRYEEGLRTKLRPVQYAAQVYTDAKSGARVPTLFAAVERAFKQHRKRVSTAVLNEVLQDALRRKQPPAGGLAKRPRIYYATQAATRPPTFVFFCSDPSRITREYRQYMENQLRESIDLSCTPIRLFWRPSHDR